LCGIAKRASFSARFGAGIKSCGLCLRAHRDPGEEEASMPLCETGAVRILKKPRDAGRVD